MAEDPDEDREEDREYERALEAAEGKVKVQIIPDVDGRPVANVVWDLWISDGIVREGSAEGPMGVREALRRAEEVMALYDLTGIVIDTADDRLWDPAWGILRPEQRDLTGTDESAPEGATEDVPTRQWI